MCEKGITLGRELTGGSVNYQKGADGVAAMRYELEPEKQGAWQQNQQLTSQNLAQEATSKAKTETIGRQLIEAENMRPRFDENVDLELLANGEKISKNAKAIIVENGRKSMPVNTTTNYIMKTCEHSRAPETFLCIRYLQNPTVNVTPAVYAKWWCSAGNHAPDDPRCGAKTAYDPPRLYKPKVVTVGPDVWVSECHALDERKARNECKIVKEECIDNAVRVINGETISRSCWKYQYTYECKYPVATSCTSLLKEGCELLNSTCKFKVGEKCYIWTQQCRCPVNATTSVKDLDYTKAFCLEGDCFNTTYEQNNEMLPSIAELSIFASMQKDIRIALNSIFKGKTLGCNKLCLGVKDCCKLSGWGLGMKIAGCNEQEKELATERQNNLCHEVGTYCAEKVPVIGTCLREKTNFCCFSSKLTRIVQEQGRGQLGKGWGDAESPNCTGFTVEELSRLDFSRLDLREAFVDFHAKPQDLARMQGRLQQKLQSIQADHKSQVQGDK